MDEHRDRFGGVEPICRVPTGHGCSTAPSPCYAFGNRPPPARSVRDAELKTLIGHAFEANFRVYGARRTWHGPNRRGRTAARCTAERLMRELGITGAVRGKRAVTALPGGQADRAPDPVERDFVAGAPNRCRGADFTCVKTRAGTVYAAFVADAFTRRIVGPSAATAKQTVFVLDALEMAVRQRGRDQNPFVPGELPHRGDTGSQYTSFRLAGHLEAAGTAASIGSVGDAYDNAPLESTIGLFKAEPIKPRRPWRTLSQAELAAAERVDWYNHRRPHGETGHVPPVEYETSYYRTATKPLATAIICTLYRTRGGSGQAVVEAVVELAQQTVQEVALGAGVPVALPAPAAVVGLGAG
ncbi:IS3 family transposase [Kitasatospora sp. NPDC088783]|uniref:IS3 family transposase n=1 Tax=Kitasatospora sp. NPDC088783 TaxID=3364077 RepID=UPI003828EA3D